MTLLARALKNDPTVALDAATLEIARVEHPNLDAEPYLRLLDEFAEKIARKTNRFTDGPAFLKAMNQFLFEDAGFQPNELDYYNPGNSCLNVVLDSRKGIPITLSIIYIEVARRLGRTVVGVGLPGHFVVQYRDGSDAIFLDPFHRGRFLSEADCNELALDHAQVEILRDPTALRPVGKPYILTRMLNNLRGAYFRVADFRKGAQVLDLLIETYPQNAEYYKARAVARMQTKQFRAANADFQSYLAIADDPPDRAEVAKQMEMIQRWMSSLN